MCSAPTCSRIARTTTARSPRRWRQWPNSAAHRARKCGRCIHIHTSQHAIAGDIGINHRCRAGIFKTAGQISGRHIAGLSPAFGGHHAIPRINPKRHAARKGADNSFNSAGIHGMARKAAIQINHMQMISTRRGKAMCLCCGVITIDRRPIHIALGQPDDLAALQVNGWKDDQAHGHHSKKRERRAMP